MAKQDDLSRYLFCQGLTDENGNLFLTDREPFLFVERSDNRHHVVTEGDTLFSLAHRYFSPLERPAKFYWVIADFQPDPIIDASLKLEIGKSLVVPSLRCLVEEIFNESRRDAFAG